MIDVLIPAYNSPATLQRAIGSVYKQTYRPIRITVLDDVSPTHLESTVRACIKFGDSELSIRFGRNKENLGPYWNIINLLHTVEENNYIVLPHDDYLIDDFFFERASDLILNRNCALVVGNSQLEGRPELMMNKYFQEFLEVSGNSYISGPLWADAHPAYSGVMFSSQIAKKLLSSGLLFERERCKLFDFEPDEGFLGIILGALNNRIALSGKVVSVRGTPEGSYSRSEYWLKEWRKNMFVVYYRLLEWSLKHSNEIVYNLALKLLIEKYRYEGPFERIKDLLGESPLLLDVIVKIEKTKIPVG